MAGPRRPSFNPLFGREVQITLAALVPDPTYEEFRYRSGYLESNDLHSNKATMSTPTRIIDSYVHDRRIGVMVELETETEFAASTREVRTALHDLALHIAASQPEDIPTLLLQAFVKDPEMTVGELISSLSSLLKEQVQVTRFIRWNAEVEEPPDPSEDPPRAPAVQMRLRSAK